MLTLLVVVAQAHAAPLVLAVVAAAAGAAIPPVDARTRVLWPLIAPDAEVLESAYPLAAPPRSGAARSAAPVCGWCWPRRR
jgi:hypothetical protein